MAKTREAELPVLAVDLGGTKIATAIISPEGTIIARDYQLTLASEGPQSVMERLLGAIGHLLERNNMTLAQISAVSIAAAGPINMTAGMVSDSPNLPGWHNVPLKSIIAEKLKTNVFLINDATAATLGEQRLGAGQGRQNLVLLAVGTGIGGGMVIDGKLYLGASGGAGELGHITIEVNGPKCNCGNIGCLETLASGTAIANEAIRRIRDGERSSLVEMVAGKIEDITAEKVSLAAQSGDLLASTVIAQAADYLGIGVVNLVNIFNPEMVIIGGSVAKMGDLLFDPVRRLGRERAFPLLANAVSIVPAQLGDDAGIHGAAIFALQQTA